MKRKNSEKSIILSSIDLDELINKFRSLIAVELSALKKPKQEKEKSTPQYYSRKEVILLLKISEPTLYRWIHKGVLKPRRIEGRVLFLRDEIEKLIAK